MKPYVILNCAMSLDGKIGKEGERVRFSSERDKLRVHELRSQVDGIMVGINTIISDDPKLTAHYSESKRNPSRIIVDNKARTPLTAKVLADNAEVIIAISGKASPSRVEKLKKSGAKVISTGERQVDLAHLLERVSGQGIRKILLEGGGALNRSMLEGGLVNELYVTITPYFQGEGISIINGKLKEEIRMNLKGITQWKDEVILHYRV